MKLTYFEGDVPNFGDELNAFIWDEVLPAGFLDTDPSELFLGIGSILWDTYPATAKKIVVGSGYGGYTPPPNVQDGSWEVVFVRGPRTAARLGLPPEKAICDSALLLRLLPSTDVRAARKKVAFMPHFESLKIGHWPQVCDRAQVPMIDPRGDPHEIIDQIRSVDVLITEAMHGAIVADALRVPWISARPVQAKHQAKWLDWAESLEIKLRSHPLPASSVQEWYQGRLADPEIWRGQRFKQMGILKPVTNLMVSRAAEALLKLTKLEPQLSGDAVVAQVTYRAAAELDKVLRIKGFPGLKV